MRSLEQWLSWQETLHPREIDLGLARVRSVFQRLQPNPLPFRTIIVGGTNGKGSCVAMLTAILRAAGYAVGTYTSPHLLRYNERIKINGIAATDAAIIDAFTRIDAAREDISLSYFEFGTLAALELFTTARVDVAVLEVGLGGRLDAINIVDADAALVVSIGIDHTEWLGTDRDSIGYEKSGIYRPNRPAICGDPDPPARLSAHAHAINARLILANHDYRCTHTNTTWSYQSQTQQRLDLPLPALIGTHQIGNAAAVLATLDSISDDLPVTNEAIRAGLTHVTLPGRFQIFAGPVEWILDVAHNPHAARVLAEQLRARPCRGKTHAIVGLLADKDAEGVIRACIAVIDHWHPVSLTGVRSRTGDDLAQRLSAIGICAATVHEDVTMACKAVQSLAHTGDRIVVFGSFHTVAPVLSAAPWSHS